MESQEIRKRFLSFFENKNHRIVPSAPMVLQNDPTLMFTNAGMNQFKDFFLGNASSATNRVTDTQKCLRVSGKHNDLEEVGTDTYHHTMFEMLGNWSFGDYFKKEAIEWAWELLTKEFHLPEDRMYVSIFEGDTKEGLALDQEASALWKALIPENRIIKGAKKDNFWEMGATGPCGPCSEIHIDLRSQEEVDQVPGRDLVNMDHPQVVEIWNLVFMQYNRMANGSLESLSAQHVDTGMGLERLVMAIQGKKSNYDTDVFIPLIDFIADTANVKYGEDEKKDIALRVISDHVRAIAFAIGDGQLPSNNKGGYVIRRILRRAVRYGYTFLDLTTPFLHTMVPILSDQFANVFPELTSQADFIAKVIKEEELTFLRTLAKGLAKLDIIIGDTNTSLDGKVAFALYDTYGFPFDLTSLIAKEHGLAVDKKGFELEMKIQKDRSKTAATTSAGDWIEIQAVDQVKFLGYDTLVSQSQIIKYRAIEKKGETQYQIVLNQTPFYAESGGQIGDTGYLTNGNVKTSIVDTKQENDLIVHYTKALPNDLNATFDAVVNEKKRKLTENNHSATHLLQAALRAVLGIHVQQKGSLVNEKLLRFDFSHFSKMTDKEIRKVEQIVNSKIRKNITLNEQRNVPIEIAKSMGATALFGEKYSDFVRVVTFDKSYSVELCGGTHIPATGHIGLLKITSESSVAAGVRRIEAITADRAEEYCEKQHDILTQVNKLLHHPKDTVKAITRLLDEKTKLNKTIEIINLKKTAQQKAILTHAIVPTGNYQMLITQAEFSDAEGLKKVSFELNNEIKNLIMIIAADIVGQPHISIMITKDLVQSLNLHAGNLIKVLAREIKGGGGGQPFYATAGGKYLAGLPAVVEKAKAIIRDIIQQTDE